MTTVEQKRPKRPSRKKKKITPDGVEEAFNACPRCGFFLAGYQLIHDDYVAAVQKSNGNVLDLSWDNATRLLLQKSYGLRIHQDTYFYEGICRDCWRGFVYKAPATRRVDESFQIEIHSG